MNRLGFWLGLAVFLVLRTLDPPAGLGDAGWATAAVAALMAVWWFTDAVPAAITGTLPFLLLPLLGVAKPGEVAADYMHPVLFLVIGGAMLGRALEKWGLHRRLAIAVVSRAGTRPERLLFGLMAATAFVSMWVNNSATTVMMLPIAGALALAARGAEGEDRDARNFGAALALSVAVASNIGGFATPVGTPVNPVAIGLIDQHFGVRIGFAEWMAFGVPIMLAALPAAWWFIARVVLPFRLPALAPADVLAAIGAQAGQAAPWSGPERRVLALLLATAAGWVTLPLYEKHLPGVTDAALAVGAALLLFVLPSGARGTGSASGPLLEWHDARDAPWYLVLLLGGGLALADAVGGTGLSRWLGAELQQLAPAQLFALVLVVTAICVLLTECSSNLGTAATFVPIAGALAIAAGHDPVPVALAAGLAASWGFANPAGTSSNAMVIGTGRVRVPEMAGVGALVDLAGVVLIACACAWLVPVVLG
ncbi:MAG: DASS family sodium-coupled anion symporter [Steroidobacteraceae bacterium]|nr:DASS family sodium-coupled anion symporter [Steroidobacteraceae bacterium]